MIGAGMAGRMSQPDPRLLIVDDTPANLDALEVLLAPTGCAVVRAQSADEALLALLQDDFAAIILDILMPGMGGLELARLIKQRRRSRDTPILFLTAHLIDRSDVLLGYGLGAVDYLSQPIHPEILRSKVSVFVELYRKTRALADLNETLQREVAERTRAQREVEVANEALEERVRERTAALSEARHVADSANQAKDQFLAMLGHELRNPLAPMVTALDLLRLRGAHSAEHDVIERQVKQLVRMVDDLLDISRITTGKELRRRGRSRCRQPGHGGGRPPAGAAAPSGGDCRAARGAAAARRRGPAGAGDRQPADQCRQVQRAGLAHHPPGCPRSRPHPSFIRERHRYPRPAQSVFGPSCSPGPSIDRGEASRGWALALASSSSTADRSSGKRRPRREARSSWMFRRRTGTSIGFPGLASDRARSSALRILVVDDNDDAAKMLETALRQLGFIVETAHDAPSALRCAERLQPDVALLDVGLPVMNGYELAQQLRASRRGSELRLIALTGYGQEADRERAYHAGFDRHFVKPIDLGELWRLLIEPLGASASPRDRPVL
jgi:CheY-like chemotaxis protein